MPTKSFDDKDLVRKKRRFDAQKRLQKKWEQRLTKKGFSMNRGLSDRVSYTGTIQDLTIIEKYNNKMGKI
jgi:hypothetical protein